MRFIFTILLFLSANLFASDKYVSSSTGDDNNNGLTSDKAWKTLNKLNASFSSLAPGDKVYLNKGDVFYGTISVSKSGTPLNPITITSYGTGAKPIITGFITVSGWTNEGGGIYSKVIASNGLANMVLIDGIQYAMGRTPNTGWRTFQTFSTNVSITDNTLGGTPNWTGAEAAIRKNDWTIDRCKITNHNVNTLTYTNLGTKYEPIGNNFSYFFQNDLRTLDSYGEWYHNYATGKFYMYFGAINPNTKTVTVATLNNLLTNLTGSDYVVVDGIAFTGSIDHAVNYAYGINYCTIKNCDISYAGQDGIQCIDANIGITLSNCTVKYCNKTGITEVGTSGTIDNNEIAYIGLIPGQAIGDARLVEGGYQGIFSNSDNSTITNNYIHSTGWNGMTVKYKGAATIQYNYMDTICLLLNDGAGIYLTGANASTRLLDHNIITNVIGNNSGVPFTNYSAFIYLDESSSNVIVSNNSGFNNLNGYGQKVHVAANNIIKNNIFYNAAYATIFSDDYAGGQIHDNNTTNNIFFARLSTQYATRFYSSINNIPSFGLFDYNYYLRPIKDDDVFSLRDLTGNSTKTLAQWKTFSGKDVHSNKSPKSISNVNQLSPYYNTTPSIQRFNFTGFSKIDVAGTVYNNSIDLPAYTGTVLIDNGSINTAPLVNAGIDQTIVLPTNSTTVTATATDPEGQAMTYLWTLVSGPSGSTISSPTALSSLITFNQEGNYTFKITATDNGSPILNGADLIVITVALAINKPPVADAGADITITLPTSTTNFAGNGTDVDGTIVSNTWTKLTGPAGGNITTTGSYTSGVTALQQGTYQYQLTVTDNRGATSTDVMQIIVNPAIPPPNINPIASADTNRTITLPISTTTLQGSATDADGTIVGYSWNVLSGPGTYTFGSSTSATTTFYNLVQGVYNVQLTATDNSGGTGTSVVVVTVNAAINILPKANAGGNQTRYLPSDTITLFGSGTDTDGTILSYNWNKMTGSPSGGTIANANTAYISISALQAGTYQYALVVTDNSGGTDTSIMILTVVAAPINQPPTSDAGADQTITLPTNSITLVGTGTDQDGAISNYLWVKELTSPAGGTITSNTSATTGITGLLEGTYMYDLIVTDNGGLKDTSTVTIIVNPAPVNNPPIVSVGAARIELTLPINYTLLVSNATDDGAVVGFAWTQLTGPNTATFGSPNQSYTSVTGLIEGTYSFRVTVTDNKGLTSFLDVTVVVSPLPIPSAKYFMIWWPQ